MIGRSPLFLTAVACAVCFLSACGDSTRDLPEIPPPGDLQSMDRFVQDQFHSLSEALSAARGDLERAEAYGKLGIWFHSYQRFEGARIAYRTARDLSPDQPVWPYFQSRLESTAGEEEAAREALETTLQLAPNYVPALVELADLEARSQSRERARELFARALEIYPKCDRALHGLAQAALEEGDADRAIEYLQEALTRQPKATALHQTIGLAYRRQGDLENARRHLQRTQIDLHEQTPISLPNPWMKRFEEVRGDARFHSQKARQALQKGDPEGAVEALRAALAAEPERVAVRSNLGQALRRAGRLNESFSELETALRMEPENVKARLQIALTEKARGRMLEAEKHFRIALDLDPDNDEARFQRAALLLRLRRHQEAFDEFDFLDRNAPTSEARRLFARLLSASPIDELRDGPRALTLIRREINEHMPIVVVETYAMAAAEAGEWEQAVAWQQAALDAVKAEEIAAPWIRRRLDRYRRGEPSRRLWEPGETPLDLSIPHLSVSEDLD